MPWKAADHRRQPNPNRESIDPASLGRVDSRLRRSRHPDLLAATRLDSVVRRFWRREDPQAPLRAVDLPTRLNGVPSWTCGATWRSALVGGRRAIGVALKQLCPSAPATTAGRGAAHSATAVFGTVSPRCVLIERPRLRAAAPCPREVSADARSSPGYKTGSRSSNWSTT